MNDGLNQIHIRTVLIPLIQLSAVIKLKRESDYNISFVYNSCRPRDLKWEDGSPLHMYIYIHIYVSSSDTALTWQSTNKKIHQEVLIRERVSKRCGSDIVLIRETYGRDRHQDITKTISLRRRDIETMNYNRIMYRTESPSLTILDEVESSKWVRTMSSVHWNKATILESVSLSLFFVMYVDSILNWMNE